MAQDVRAYGAQDLLGRPLTINEVTSMNVALNIYNAYISREKSGDWAAWTKEISELAEILSKAAHNV